MPSRVSRRPEPALVIDVEGLGRHKPLPVGRRQLSEYEQAVPEAERGA